MQYTPSALWLSPPDDLKQRLGRCLDEALDMRLSAEPVITFFRADDIGAPGKQFARVIEIFSRHRVPLSLAVVPHWLHEARWKAIRSIAGENPSLWCWHQHGRSHKNYEPEGQEKQEFGPARTTGQIIEDLEEGWKRLVSLMGDEFYPVFTPPWNRCSKETLGLIGELAYYAISRKQGAVPTAPRRLPDLAVNTDLHTRKETDPEQGWNALFTELKQSVAGGFCGIMLHHQRMNGAAFDFLELLVQSLKNADRFRLFHFRNMVGSLGLRGSI